MSTPEKSKEKKERKKEYKTKLLKKIPPEK